MADRTGLWSNARRVFGGGGCWEIFGLVFGCGAEVMLVLTLMEAVWVVETPVVFVVAKPTPVVPTPTPVVTPTPPVPKLTDWVPILTPLVPMLTEFVPTLIALVFT